MHEDETGPERSTPRFRGIFQTIIISAVAALLYGLGKLHALSDTQAAWSLATCLPLTMALMARLNAER